MKTRIFLSTLLLIIPFSLISEEVIKDSEIKMILIGKMAYAEKNYSLAYSTLSQYDFSQYDRQTFWQLCHSAFYSGQEKIFISSFQKTLLNHPHHIEIYNDFFKAYLGQEPSNMFHYGLISKEEWHLFFDCLPESKKMAYLNNIYTQSWLQDPSLRSFILELLISWNLGEDALELASLGFDNFNKEWLDTCDLYFSNSQLAQIYATPPHKDCPQDVKLSWYKNAIRIYAEDNHKMAELVSDIYKEHLPNESLFTLAMALYEAGYGIVGQEFLDRSDPSDQMMMEWGIMESCANKAYDSAYEKLNIYSQFYIKNKSTLLHQAETYLKTKCYQKAWATCEKIPSHEKTKESYVIQACALAHLSQDQSLPFLLSLYRDKKISHREITAVQAYCLRLKGERYQADLIWNNLKKQEKSSLAHLERLITEINM